MMQIAQLVENREIIRSESNLNGYAKEKYPHYPSVNSKSNATMQTNESKSNTILSMRTITLRGVAPNKTRKEGPTKRLPDAEFQAKKEKGLCFRCN